MDQEKRISERRRNSDRRDSERRVDADRSRRKKAQKKGGIYTLIALASLSTGALALFFLIQSGIGDAINWNKLLYIQNKPVQDFEMGGIELGMRPDVVEREHPNMNLTSLVKGEKVGMFKTNEGKYTVWFVSINGNEKAYRIRFDQVIKGMTETDIIEDMGRRHGKPSTSECAKSVPSVRTCEFQWWPSGGIALNIFSSTDTRKKQTVTGISVIATDTYLDGKRIRNLGQ